MSGFFGVVSKSDCVFDLFFGVDFHSHLGTRRAGLAVYNSETGFDRSIHNIEGAPFRTKFQTALSKMSGNMGIGSISDFEAQPILLHSKHGTYAIATVGRINNSKEIAKNIINDSAHFFIMRSGELNQTELTAAIINQKDNIIEGIKYAQEIIEGSISIMILTERGIYVARDKLGRTPVVIGAKEGAYCAAFESFSFLNLGYHQYKELGPGEIAVITEDGVKELSAPGKDMKICTFLWVYYGYPASSYEGISVEQMRNNCGKALAERDDVKSDSVAGIPESGVAHAIGYANAAGIPYARPFIKYTPTWARSFMPSDQKQRSLIAKMKLIPVHELIDGKRLLLIDDSIVRGTQLRETTEFLYESGAKEVHIRPSCPPLLFSCKYLNFSRSGSDMELITRKVIAKLEGEDPSREVLAQYADPDSDKYKAMVEMIRKELHFTTLQYNRIDDLIAATGLPAEKLCTYCWTGKEE